MKSNNQNTSFTLILLLLLTIILLVSSCGETIDDPDLPAGSPTLEDETSSNNGVDDNGQVNSSERNNQDMNDITGQEKSMPRRGANIPDDYPKDIIPFYKNVDILMAQVLPASDDGKKGYSIICGSKDAYEVVLKDVIDFFENTSGKILSQMDMGEMYMIIGETKGYGYTVTVGASEIDDEEYETHLSYSVYDK